MKMKLYTLVAMLMLSASAAFGQGLQTIATMTVERIYWGEHIRITVLGAIGKSITINDEPVQVSTSSSDFKVFEISILDNQTINIKAEDASDLIHLDIYGDIFSIAADLLGDSSLASLDVSGCAALQYLSCNGHSLTFLDVSGCVSLKELYCSGNSLTSLDVSECVSLQILYCGANRLTSLDISGCVSLHTLWMPSNYSLTSLNLAGCVSLKELYCSANSLTSLDVSECVSLQILYCGANRLTSLDVSECVSLQILYCGANRLTSLDISGCVSLHTLDCSYNSLTSLNLAGCVSLQELYCGGNDLTSLNVSGFASLHTLDCSYNSLTSLNLAGCVSLQELYCGGNDLTSLNISGLTSLRSLDCSDNSLTSLDVSGLTSLQELYCYDNVLTSLNVFGCNALHTLYAYNQKAVVEVPFNYSRSDVDIYFNGTAYPYAIGGFSVPIGIANGSLFSGTVSMVRAANNVPVSHNVSFVALAGVTINKASSNEVVEGSSFAFNTTLANQFADYELTVLVNGKELTPAAANVYTIDNIRENKLVSFILTQKTVSPTLHNVTFVPLDGVSVDKNSANEVADGFYLLFNTTIANRFADYDLTVLVNGRVLAPIAGNAYVINDIDEDKVVNFVLTRKAVPTSNGQLTAASISTGVGEITIETAKSASIQIISISGKVVYSASASGTTSVNVPAGIYIVVVDGKSTKVVVR